MLELWLIVSVVIRTWIRLLLLTGLAGKVLLSIVGRSLVGWIISAALGVAYGLRELEIIGVSLPFPTRLQTTPARWRLTLGLDRASFLWGVQLGIGVTTVVPYALFYFLLACVFVLGSPRVGLEVMAVYGLPRAIPTVDAGVVPVACGVSPRAVSEWPMRRERILLRANAAALIVGAILLASFRF